MVRMDDTGRSKTKYTEETLVTILTNEFVRQREKLVCCEIPRVGTSVSVGKETVFPDGRLKLVNGKEYIIEAKVGNKNNIDKKHEIAKEQSINRRYVEKTNSRGLITIVFDDRLKKDLTDEELRNRRLVDVRIFTPEYKLLKEFSELSIRDIPPCLDEYLLEREERKQRSQLDEGTLSFVEKFISMSNTPNDIKTQNVIKDASMLLTEIMLSNIASTDFDSMYKTRHLDYIVNKAVYIDVISRTEGETIKYMYQKIIDLDKYEKEFLDEVRRMNEFFSLQKYKDDEVLEEMDNTLYNESIDTTERKNFGAFYTLPQAARLMALFIDEPNAKVLDPACGSGNLLLASAMRKLQLYKHQGGGNYDNICETEIVGCDIREDACVIANRRLNQNRNTKRGNFTTQIIKEDGLKLYEKMKWRKNIFSYNLFKDLPDVDEYEINDIEGKKIELAPFDYVIMNPPFGIRDEKDGVWKEFTWLNFINNSMNLLEDNGKIITIVPPPFLTSSKLKDIVNNYYIEYIILPDDKVGFTVTDAKTEKFIVVINKRKVKRDEMTTIVQIIKPIQEFTDEEVDKMVETDFQDENIASVRKIPYTKIQSNFDRYLSLRPSIYGDECIDNFLDEISKSVYSTKLKDIVNDDNIRRVTDGLSMKKINYVLFIARQEMTGKSHNCPNIFKSETDTEVTFINNENEYTVSKKYLTPTVWRVRNPFSIDIKNYSEYIFTDIKGVPPEIIKDYDKKQIHQILEKNRSLIKKNMIPLSFLQDVPKKGQGFHILAVYGDEKFMPCIYHTMKINDVITRKILALYLNSLPMILYTLQNIHTSTGWRHVKKEKFVNAQVIDPQKLTPKQTTNLLKLFDEIRNEYLPTIEEQCKTRHPVRVKLDTEILRTIGFDDKWITENLNILYDKVIEML